MTICDVHLAADRRRALVAVDSLSPAGGVIGHGAKFLLLPHLHALLAVRGVTQVVMLAADQLTRAGHTTFDQARAALPGICRRVDAALADELALLEDVSSPELVAVGWSASAGGYAAISHSVLSGFEPVEQEVGCSVRPGPPGYFLPPAEPTLEDMCALAEQQYRQTQRELGDPAILGSGGRLVLIEMGGGATTVTVAHELGAYDGDPIEVLRATPWWPALKAAA